MVNTLIRVALVAATAVSAMPNYEAEFEVVALLKRQQPGTPAYNCHDNCGQVIIANRQLGDALCDNAGFKSNYANCLQCAGPDNVGIWSMYGTSVSAAGTKCGLSTTPLSGKQPDVGPAVPATASTTAATTITSAAQPTTTSANPPASTTTTTTSGAGPAPSSTTTGGGAATSSSRASSSSSGAAATSSTAVSSTSRAATTSAATTTSRSGSGSGSGSTNGTTTSRGPTVTAGASQNVVGVFGAIMAVAAWAALA